MKRKWQYSCLSIVKENTSIEKLDFRIRFEMWIKDNLIIKNSFVLYVGMKNSESRSNSMRTE